MLCQLFNKLDGVLVQLKTFSRYTTFLIAALINFWSWQSHDWILICGGEEQEAVTSHSNLLVRFSGCYEYQQDDDNGLE